MAHGGRSWRLLRRGWGGGLHILRPCLLQNGNYSTGVGGIPVPVQPDHFFLSVTGLFTLERGPAMAR